MASLLLYAPEDFHNLCLLARTLEASGYAECFVFDPHRIVRERYGKVRSRELRAVSAGAFEQIRWHRIEQPRELIARHEGRVVATVPEPSATPLEDHRARRDDLLVFGAESTGLPPEILELVTAKVTIPLYGRTRSLNLAVAFGVVLFEYGRQLGPPVAGPRTGELSWR